LNYRYAFQGQELDGETGMEAFQLRLWDGRIGRWLSPDPMGQYASPYLGMGNNPISRIDPDGGSDYPERDGYGCGDTWNDADGSWTWDSDQNMWLGQNGTTSNWSHSVTVGDFNSPMISQLSGFNSTIMDFERWRRDDNSNLLLHLGAELTYGTADNVWIFLTGFGTNRRGISGETYDGDRGAGNGLDGFITLATAGFGAAAKAPEELLKSTPKLWNSFQKMHVKPATRLEVSQAYKQMLLKNHNQFYINKKFETFNTFYGRIDESGKVNDHFKK
jgi:RHS repeat-associated protein